MARDDPQIQRLRQQFVCVRITRMNGVNLRRFQFDYDTTWNAFFLDERLNIYSRYGGRDEGEPEARLSTSSLLQTMREVLALHRQKKQRPLRQQAELFQPVDAGVFTPHDIPLLRQSHQGCVHCHQVGEYRFLQAGRAGTFSRRQLYDWPLPENIGLVFDRSHGHRVQRVLPNSPAERAKLQKGEIVTRLENVPVHSEYDLRWALGRVKENRPVRLTVSRSGPDGKTMSRTVMLQLTGDWRATELGWRKSLRSVPVPFGFRGYSLTRSQRREMGLTEGQLALRIVSVRNNSLAASLGLQKKDTILALGKQSRHRTLEELFSDLLRHYRPGETVRMTVLRNGRRVSLSGPFPHWRAEETSIP